jgi:hypothetical protein
MHLHTLFQLEFNELGANDFGLIVDGTVIIVEATLFQI